MMMEMKKDWMDPQTIVQDFVPNEYVAACGESGAVYKFVCDAGVPNSLFLEVSTPNKGDVRTIAYHPCGATHEASTQDEFISGYVRGWKGLLSGGWSDYVPVMIWTDGGTNTHCTTNVKMETWEIAKS